jgi:hypothetical protein
MMKLPFAIAALAVVAMLVLWRAAMPAPMPPMPRGIPVEKIANGRIAPQVGLVAPLPNWIPLPERGRVVGASLYPPQLPWGAAAVVMLQIEQPADLFVAAYRKRLDQAGFAMHRTPIPANVIIDAADSAYEADERKGGHAVFVTMRKTYYAQLTFWSPPIPYH